MFEPLRNEVGDRFNAIESFLRPVQKLNGQVAQTAKGLAFVQLYAVYEFTVTSAVQVAINALVAHCHKTKNLTPSLMALFMDAHLESLRNVDKKKMWKSRLNLFNEIFSDNPAVVANTVLPSDGSHFRYTQLQTIFEVFGIQRIPAARRSHLLRIDEVVRNRNAVAHGRETPDNVGKRYSGADVLHRLTQMRSVCLLFVSTMKGHCEKPEKHCTSPTTVSAGPRRRTAISP
jgi:hypothetical protein